MDKKLKPTSQAGLSRPKQISATSSKRVTAGLTAKIPLANAYDTKTPVVKKEPLQVNIGAIKPEPIDVILSGIVHPDGGKHEESPPPTSASSLHTFDAHSAASGGEGKLHLPFPFVPKAPAAPLKPTLTMYNGPHEIVYTPEQALEHGLAMIEKARESIAMLHIGNKMRQDVWNRDLQRLQKTGAQKTMIALCGGECGCLVNDRTSNRIIATGAGKSSVINALLNDNIVPTSGMRACTATVTEIAYHKRSTIDADIEFLTRDEWLTELSVLLDELLDDDNNLKPLTDMRNDAGVAWHKVHTVYPALTAEQLIRMKPEQIIASDLKLAQILDTTKKLRCPNSKEFSKEINKYIDSKNRDKKDKKKKEKEGPAYWPLIKQVKVWVKAEALSTGAVLCDLPGTADTNAARSSIAKEYMKIANCIWILAPIHRAVDDKTARDLLGDAFKTQLLMDGNYDGSTVTFIATKADDVAASEIVRALGLEDEPDLMGLEERIEDLRNDAKTAKKAKESAVAEIKSLAKQVDRHKSVKAELEDHLRCLKLGKKFVPRLTAKKKRQHGDNPKKRKSMGTGGRGNTKRRKSSPNDSEESSEEASGSGTDFIADTDLEEESDDQESSDDERASKKKSKRSKSKKSRSRRSTPSSASDDSSDESDELDSDDSENRKSKSKSRGKSKKSKKRSRGDSDDEENEDSDAESTDGDEAAETEGSLKVKISAEKAEIERIRSKIADLKEEKTEASSNLAKAKKRLSFVQKEKNAFCALKRAEYSRDVLKVDFRTGLRNLDESAALARDATTFDPSVALRDYDAIDLPVYCVSARDYARIHKLNRGDGDPSTFSEDAQTEIPALREWCQHLTVASRESTVKIFLESTRVFVRSILSYVEGLEGISDTDRDLLRHQWQTPAGQDTESESEDDNPYAWILAENGDGLFAANKPSKAPAKDSKGNLIGIYPRLYSEFAVLVEDTVDNLKETIKDGLESKCEEGVELAATSALDISDEFAQAIHWQTYRATLRREGSFRQDLNELLCAPLTKRIASSWAQVFAANLFASIDIHVLSGIKDILKRMETSTNHPGLKEKCQSQGELAIEEAKAELSKLVTAVSTSLQSQQKDISRCIAPTVKEALHNGYVKAAEKQGKGSVALQRAVFRAYLDNVREEIFGGCQKNLFAQLDTAAENVEDQLDTALLNLAQKVEVNLSVLWEGSNDTPEQRMARTKTKFAMLEISRQVLFWQQAAQDLGAAR